MKNQKGISVALLVVMIAVVVIAAAGGAWYIVSQNENTDTDITNKNIATKNTNIVAKNTNTSTATSDWFTYTNNTYYYSIQYPKSLPLNSDNPADIVIGTVPFEPGTGFMSLMVMENKDLTYIDEYKTSKPNGCPEESDATIGGKLAKNIICIGAFSGEREQAYFIEKDGNLYEIFWVRGDSKLDSTFEQMIDTFQFLR